MKERPILFSAEMVRAILRDNDPKWQTRRIVKGVGLQMLNEGFTPRFVADPGNSVWCPYGKAGDRLWVRESFIPDPPIDGWSGDIEWNGCGRPINGVPEHYRKPENCIFRASWTGDSAITWHPSIHMPRWASRITLEITKIRIERLEEISEEDAKAEGASESGCSHPDCGEDHKYGFRAGYCILWNKINGKTFPWGSNPWVWVVEFKKL